MTGKRVLEGDTVVRRSSDILESDIDGEVVMMSVARGEYYGLDAIGSEIWSLLEEPLSVDDICARLLPQYEVEEDEGRRDVIAFLQDLLSDGSLVAGS